MTVQQFLDGVCSYAGTTMASKAKSKVTQFVLGAVAAGAGRAALESKVSGLVPYIADGNGEVDVEAVRESVMSGLKASGSLPILGGLVSVDASDAAEFFKSIGTASA